MELFIFIIHYADSHPLWRGRLRNIRGNRFSFLSIISSIFVSVHEFNKSGLKPPQVGLFLIQQKEKELYWTLSRKYDTDNNYICEVMSLSWQCDSACYCSWPSTEPCCHMGSTHIHVAAYMMATTGKHRTGKKSPKKIPALLCSISCSLYSLVFRYFVELHVALYLGLLL